MTGGGSQQLRQFRVLMRDGWQIEQAAAHAGMSIGEARIHVANDAKNPPPPECFELLGQQQKEPPMGRGRMAREPQPDTESGEGGGINGEYERPNAELAFQIYDNQIAPKLAHLNTIKGDLSQPREDLKDKAHFPRSVLDFIIRLEGLEDAKRDHHLLALAEGLKFRQLFLPRDLVTMANGEDGGEVIPTGDRDDDVLSGLDEDDDFQEASEDELALQAGRGAKSPPDDDSDLADPSGVEPTTGTGAAAIAAMKKAAAKPAAKSAAVTH